MILTRAWLPAAPSAIRRVVGFSSRHCGCVIVVAVALCAGAFFYSARHIAIDTDTAKLIAADVPWRQREIAFDAAFPQRADLIVVVIDAMTPELAERATAMLTARLQDERPIFRAVWRPDGGPFFDREGLLLQDTAEVARTTQALIAAQPLLGTIAADPSLRGVMDALARLIEGVSAEPARSDELVPALDRLAAALEEVAAGRPASLSWGELITGRSPELRDRRRFILVNPVLDYSALRPGEAASEAIRQAARDLDVGTETETNKPRVRVRLTGPVPLADEEFATLADGAALHAAIMIGALLALLWAALRSWRLIAAVMSSLAAGLIVTAAFGLALFGSLNLISVAFAVLFVGLGVDFGIQFCVCYRAKRHVTNDLQLALRSAGEEVGPALALAAGSIAAGFLAFLPTEYRGVSELGAIAGSGMVVAFVATITLLPALIVPLRPPGERAAVGYPALAPLDRFLVSRRSLVLALSAIVAAASLALLPRLTFDFNPLHLKSPQAESVATLLDLMQDSTTTPNTLDVLAPSVADAQAMAQRLEQLPEVDHAITLATFVPDLQQEKLGLIDDAALLLDPVLHPDRIASPPTDSETAAAMASAAQSLEHFAVAHPDLTASTAAARLARAVRTLAQAEPALRERAKAMLVPGLGTALNQLRAAMQARPVTVADLPDDLVLDWVARDGRARIEVFPRGETNDNATLERFVAAVRQLAPEATGAPVSIQESSRTIVRAFAEAGALALFAIILLLAFALRSVRDILLALAPLLLSGLVTMAICAAIDLPLNFENIIALPLLAGIGVAFSIYFVMAWRAGRSGLLQSSLTRAVIFSALTTATAFGSLWLSHHPGTSSMGKLLALSLASTLVCVLLLLPAILGEPRQRH